MFDGNCTAREFWWFTKVDYAPRNFIVRFRKRVERLRNRAPWWSVLLRRRCTEQIHYFDYLLATN